MNDNNFILKAENLHKSYRMGRTQVSVLKGLDLAVKKGEFLAIVGASGSGKSTLLHILGALDRPDKGVVSFKGQNLQQLTNNKLNKFRNAMVGFVFQFYHLLDELNVLENVFMTAIAGKSVLLLITSRAICCTSRYVLDLTSPARTTCPVVTRVSHATFDSGSKARK